MRSSRSSSRSGSSRSSSPEPVTPAEPAEPVPDSAWLGRPACEPDLAALAFADSPPGGEALPPAGGAPEAHWALAPLLAANLAHRDPASPSGLFTLGGADAAQADAPEIPYGFGAPLFAPPGWTPCRRALPGLDDFVLNFESLPGGPVVRRLLRDAGPALAARGVGLAAAGGSVVAGLCGSPADDFDLFLWGGGLDSEAECWRALHFVAACLRRAALSGADPNTVVWERLSPGVFTAFVRNCGLRRRASVCTVQVILRRFPSLSLALHGFDLPCCAVAFDGAEVFLSAAALFSLTFRAVPVVPEYSSASFGRRIEKYFRRGFALLLPGLAPDALLEGTFSTPAFTLGGPIRPYPELGLFRGAFSSNDPRAPASNYELSPAGPDFDTFRYSVLASVARTPRGTTPSFLGLEAPFRCRDGRGSVRVWIGGRYGFLTGARGGEPKGLDFSAFHLAPPSLADLCSEAAFSSSVRRAAGSYGRRGGSAPGGLTPLVQVLRLSEADALALDVRVAEFFLRNPRCRKVPGLSEFLAPYVASRCRDYASFPQAIPWWFAPEDSASQATASFRPTFESAAAWYGARASDAWLSAGPPPPPSDALKYHLILFDQPGRVVGADPVCSVCQERVAAGAPNSVALHCGHVFHYGRSSTCPGVKNWLRARGRTCPNCRRDPDPEAGGAGAGSGSGSDAGAGAGSSADVDAPQFRPPSIAPPAE